jgi:hypothetical protein
MTVSWRWRLAGIFGRGRGVNSMMVALLVAGICFLLAGLSAVGFGIQINEFSLGNALIIAGTVAASAGMLLIGLWVAVKEITRLLGPGVSADLRAGMGPEPATAGAAARKPARQNGGLESAGHAEPPVPSPPPWQEGAGSRDRAPGDAPAAAQPVEAEPAAKPRRNLLFSSSSRKERERAQTRTTEPSMAEMPPAPVAAPPVSEPEEAPPVSFDDAWPKPDRARGAETPVPRRSARTPSTFAEPGAERQPPAARGEEPPAVTVLKSGVVDGMAYSLYSDGSIEAQMPEGMMRFASIDELRAHLDHRP